MPERVRPWPEIYDTLNLDRHNSQAWNEIAARVRPWVWSGLRGFDEGIREDAVQDTCTRAFANFDDAHGRNTFSGFVYACFMSARRDILLHKPPRTTDIDEVSGVLLAPEQIGMERDDRQAIHDCINGLQEDDRELVTLCCFEEYKPHELTRRLGKNANAIRVQLHRARKQLRWCLRQKLNL